VWVRASGSTGTGRAPVRLTASHVPTNVFVGTITSSPGPMSHARSVSASASQPVPTATQWLLPQYSANAASNASSSGPSRYRPDLVTRRQAVSSSSASSP
jgi:hypothetical protein